MRMKIKNIWILIVVVAIVVAIMAFKFGFVIWPFLVFYVGVIVIYGIIDGIGKFANKLIDSMTKRQAVGNEEINVKIEFMMQRMQVIENKVDKINTILEKVSE
jgi:cell shape-determining protein MreC